MRRVFAICILLGATVFVAAPVRAAVIDHTAGMIVLQIESHGEAWYVDPVLRQRIYLGRPTDAFDIMRERGLGITNADLAQIPVAGSAEPGNVGMRLRLAGRILLQVEKNGEAWYVYPKDTHRYYLGRPDDAFQIMKSLGLGISNANLALISAVGAPLNTYEHRIIDSARGSFGVHITTIDLSNSLLEVVTDTANESNCADNCPAKSLADYIQTHQGIAGMHGTYFCPPDYAACADETNSYLWPVYNSQIDRFINGERLAYTTGPIMVFDTNNTPYFFYRTNDFWSVEQFESRYSTKIQAAISNGPALILNGTNVVNLEPMDDKQRNTKGNRGGIGVKGMTLYMVIAQSATVLDLAAIFEALDVDHAMNLDGGGTSAMYFNGTYQVGPGRLLPNAFLVHAR
ncbi:MAG: phosphodiester glycosidase family protein [Parcubacteria group bacterium]